MNIYLPPMGSDCSQCEGCNREEKGDYSLISLREPFETPQIVHLKRKAGLELVSCDVYIGRAMFQGGWRLPESKWAPPRKYSDEDHENWDLVLYEYENYIRSRADLMSALPELEGKKLGCWCAPARCHGDVLAKLLSEKQKNILRRIEHPPKPLDTSKWSTCEMIGEAELN